MLTLNRRRFTQLAALGLALPAAPARAEIRKVRLGVLRLASSGAVFIAQDSGYFQQAGLDVELVFFDAAQPIAVACASGDIDFGVTAFTAGLFNLAGKGAVAVIAGQSREVPGFPLDAYLAPTTPAGAALTSPKDIRGRSVGITQIGSSFHYAAGLLAEKYGFPISEVKFVPLQSMSNIVAALTGGGIQMALLPATSAQAAIQAGNARLLGWGGDHVPWQLGAAFVSAKMQKDAATIEQFLVAYKRACRDYHDSLVVAVKDGIAPLNPATELLLNILAKYTNQPVERLRGGLAFVERDGKLDLPNVAHQIGWYQAQGFVDKGFGLDQVVDRRFTGS